MIGFVLECRGGRDEFDRLSVKGRRHRGQPDRTKVRHRIEDLQIDILTTATGTKSGLGIVERGNNDRSLRGVDKRIKSTRIGRLGKRLNI